MAWSRGDFKTALLPYRLYIRERQHEVAIITVAANDHPASRKPSLRQRQPTRRAYASQKRRSKLARRRSMIGRPPTKSTIDFRGCWRDAVGNDASRRVAMSCAKRVPSLLTRALFKRAVSVTRRHLVFPPYSTKKLT